jgi:hypothetical protein
MIPSWDNAGVPGKIFLPPFKQIFPPRASTDGTAKILLMPEAIMEWLKTTPIQKLNKEEKEKLGIADFNID